MYVYITRVIMRRMCVYARQARAERLCAHFTRVPSLCFAAFSIRSRGGEFYVALEMREEIFLWCCCSLLVDKVKCDSYY